MCSPAPLADERMLHPHLLTGMSFSKLQLALPKVGGDATVAAVLGQGPWGAVDSQVSLGQVRCLVMAP